MTPDRRICQGRLSQRSNDVMKVLTILSAILLPSVALAAVMGIAKWRDRL